MKVLPIIIGAFGMVPKGYEWGLEEIRGQAGTIQNPTLLRSARLLRRVLDTPMKHLQCLVF